MPMMPKILKTTGIWILALLLGAFVPALALCVTLLDLSFLMLAFPITLAHAVIFGLPAALLYRAMKWTGPVCAALGGFIIGAVPLGIYMWPVDRATGANAWNATAQTIRDGVPTLQGWLQYAEFHGSMGLAGVVGALTFRAILKWGGVLRTS